MKAERKRQEMRRDLEPIRVDSITSLDWVSPIARGGSIVNASASGFKLILHRTDFVPKYLRSNLSLDSLIGERVLIFIRDMNLEISGSVARTKHIGSGEFELAVDFSEDAPQYWRECLLDLLPSPGEF